VRFIISAPPCIVSFIVDFRSRRMRWAVHVAFMEEKTYAQRTLHVNRGEKSRGEIKININPLNAELNPICHLLALLGAHSINYISRARVKIYPQKIGTKVAACFLRNQDRNQWQNLLKTVMKFLFM
jgi:hypothetical protein